MVAAPESFRKRHHFSHQYTVRIKHVPLEASQAAKLHVARTVDASVKCRGRIGFLWIKGSDSGQNPICDDYQSMTHHGELSSDNRLTRNESLAVGLAHPLQAPEYV